MSDPTPPRRPAFGSGRPVPPAQPAVPARPPVTPARPTPPPTPAFEVVEEDDGFEVVDEAPPEPRPAHRPVRAEPAAEPKPVRKPLRAEADDTAEDRPRPKKRKKKRRVVDTPDDDGQAARDRALAEYEWYWPLAILAVGLVVCFVGGIGAGGAVGLVQTVGVLVLGLMVSIPLSVAALMAIGILAGIEYGRFGPAVLKLAAITCVANGIMLIGAWQKLPFFVYLPISGVITLGLFMTQFELDWGEANTSVGAINLFTFLANIVLIGFLAGATAKSGGGADELPDDGPDPDDPPAFVDPGERPKKDRPKPAKRRPANPDDDFGPDDE